MTILSDYDRVWSQEGLSLQSAMIGFDLEDIDNRMDKEGYWEYQLDCIRQDHGDTIRPNPFLDQLLCQIGKSEIGHGYPHLITNGVGRGIRLSGFSSLLHMTLSLEKDHLNILMCLTSFLCKLTPHDVTRPFKSHMR